MLEFHLEKLSYFATIAKFGSISKAAGHLRIAQPSLSRSVNILEGILGAELFLRSKTGVTVTPAGTQLLNASEEILNRTRLVEHVIKRERRPRLSLGTYAVISSILCPDLLHKVSILYPNIEFSLYVDSKMNNFAEKLKRSELDLVFSSENSKDIELHKETLFTDTLGFFCRPDMKIRKLDKEMITEHSFIFPPNLQLVAGTELREFLPQFGIRQKDGFLITSIPAIKAISEKNDFICVLPRIVAMDSFKAKRLKEVRISGSLQQSLTYHFYCYSLKSTARQKINQDAVQIARALVDKILV